MTDLPNIDTGPLKAIDMGSLYAVNTSKHRPRILLLYGSLRDRSFSRLVTEEAARLLQFLGAETRTFDPSGLSLPDDAEDTHKKTTRTAIHSNLERGHGLVQSRAPRRDNRHHEIANRLDSNDLESSTANTGQNTAVMQVCGGSQSFNAVNQMRLLGRWMRLVTTPNQSSVAKAWMEFDDSDRIKPSSYYDRIVDVCEELVKFTLLLRDNKAYFLERYSERKETTEQFRKRIDKRPI